MPAKRPSEELVNERTFVEKFITNPASIATILIAILGQAVISVGYQIINNEKQQAAIELISHQLTEFKFQVNNLQTPLSTHVLKLEDKTDDIRKAYDEVVKRIDQIDTAGTRALALVTSNQQRVMSQVDRLGDRILMQDKSISDIKASNPAGVLQARIEEISRNLTRLEDQQRRIIEALDSLYSQVSKMPSANKPLDKK